MPSAIDPTKPTTGNAFTPDVRQNFAYAKAEIEALQSSTASGPFLPLSGGTLTGPLNYIATGGSALRSLQARSSDVTNVLDYGVVGDGVDTGSAFTGTDNTAAFQAALNYAGSAGKTVFVPPLVYRFQGVAVDDTAVLTLPSYCRIVGYGATFLVDENTSITGASLRDFMRSTGWGGSMVRTLNELLRIDGVTWKGRWSHAPISSVSNKGISFLAAANYREVILAGVRAFDCRGNFSRCRSNDAVSVTGGHFERVCSDTLRFTDSPNCLIDGNYVKETGDNAISLHAAVTAVPTAPYINRPTRAGLIVVNNRMVQCVAPTILGPHTIVYANNVMQRCNGGVAIGLALPPEGTNTQADVSVHGNIFEDHLQRWSAVAGAGSFPAQTRSSGALIVGGAVATGSSSPAPPGEYDAVGVKVVTLWGSSPTPAWGYLHTGNSAVIAGTSQQSSAGSVNIRVCGNVIARTLPDAAHFSDWGFGQLFASTGYVDPPINVNSFRLSGLVMSADMRNFLVSDNIISGWIGGGGIYLDVPNAEVLTANMFLAGVIKGNIVKNCQIGMTSTFAGDLANPARSIEMLIEGNYFDVDPYVQSSFRTSPIDGTWPSSGGTSNFPTGINTNGWKGFIIRGNVFANAYIPIGPTLATATANAHIEGNVCVCDPVATGYNTGNRGIASVPPAGPAFRHLIVDSNPTSATWRQLKNSCVMTAAAMPTTGVYVQGQLVTNSVPAVAAGKVLVGWGRLTTGSAHVSGADWSPLYCTVS